MLTAIGMYERLFAVYAADSDYFPNVYISDMIMRQNID